MTALEPAILVGQRLTGRALAGVRTAPYLRKWLVLGTLIGVVADSGLSRSTTVKSWPPTPCLPTFAATRPRRPPEKAASTWPAGFSRPPGDPLVVAGGGLAAGLLVFGVAPRRRPRNRCRHQGRAHEPKGVRPRVMSSSSSRRCSLSARAAQGAEKARQHRSKRPLRVTNFGDNRSGTYARLGPSSLPENEHYGRFAKGGSGWLDEYRFRVIEYWKP